MTSPDPTPPGPRAADPDAAGRMDAAARLLADADGMPAAERDAFFEREASGDAELLRLLRSLAPSLDESSGFLATSPGGALRSRLDHEGFEPVPPDGEASLAPGTRFGDFHLVRRIAQGGMGTVYEAEQVSPRRRVALKLVAPGMASPEVLRRFRLEGEMLAHLSHPGIAKVLAVSEPDAPEPWFAMELVEGASLTEHAEAAGLSVPERLGLLAAACDAIAHAHARGIVHRDLKPANILVDSEGHPRILDFGVARASELESRAATLLTRTGDLVGTLAYMSPEQAWGRPEAVDARADVYSLGVIGFELVTGRLPRKLDGLNLGEALHVLRDGDVERAESVDPSLRGDVSTLLAKALEADPAERYGSAADLAADIRRLLRDEPIAARPPSVAYRTRKFLRRHRILATVTLVAFVALGLVAALAVRSAIRADTAGEAASSQAYRASLAAAAAGLEAGNPASALAQLDDVAPARRGWEWFALRERLSPPDATAIVPGSIGVAFSDDARTVHVLAERPDDAASSAMLVRVDLALPGLAVVSEGAENLVKEGDPAAWRALVRLWQLKLPGSRSPPGGEVLATLSVSADLRRAATWPVDLARGSVVDLATGTELARMPRGLMALTSGGDRVAWWHGESIGIFDVSTGGWPWRDGMGAAPGTGIFRKHEGIMSVAFAADERSLLVSTVGSSTRLLRLDASTGRELATFAPRARPGWQADGWHAAARGSRVAWSAGDGSIHLFDAELTRELGIVNGTALRRTRTMALSPDGTALCSVDDAGQVAAWDLERALIPRVATAHESYGYGVAFSPDGARFATVGWDHRARVWDARSFAPVRDIPFGGGEDFPADVSWLPDGRRIVLLSTDGRVSVVDAGSGEVRATRGFGSASAAPRLAVAPGGDRGVIARALYRQPSAVFSLPDLSPLGGFEDLTGVAAFSPDGRRLASGLMDGSAVLVDLDTGARRALAIGDPADMPLQARFSADGRLLVVTFFSGRTILFDGEGRLLRELRAPSAGRVHDAVVSSDGTRIVTGGEDGAVRVWDAVTGDLVASFAEHALYVRSLAFSPDGRTLVSISGDGTVRRWSAR